MLAPVCWKLAIPGMVVLAALLAAAGCDDLEPDLFPGFDEAPPEDADLTGYRRTPRGKNGFELVNFGVDEDVWPDESERIEGLGDELDLEAARAVVAKGEGLLRRLEEALACPELQVPEPRGPDDLVPHLLLWRSLAYLASCKSRCLEEAGDLRGALAQAMSLVRFGRRIEAAQGTTITYLVGVAIRSIGMIHLRRLLPREELAAESWRPVLEELKGLGSDRAGLRDVLRAEYVVLGSTFVRLAAGESELREALDIKSDSRWTLKLPFFKPQQTRRLLAAEVRRLIANAGLPTADREGFTSAPRYETKKRLDWFLANSGGKTVVLMVTPTIERVTLEADKSDFAVSALRVLLALNLFAAEHGGELPVRLAELVPRYLEAVPTDPFDGQPLRYSRAKRIVYSVGADFKDAGGSAGEEAEPLGVEEADEPTLRIPEWSTSQR